MPEANMKPHDRIVGEIVSSQMPVELSERISKEARENDEIYRRRSFDTLNLSETHYGHRQMLNWAFQHLPSLCGARVLDIGVGEGQSSVIMARSGAQVTGIDVSAEALERARELARRCGVAPEFLRMAGEELHFSDESFDAILCMSAFHHMDLDRASREFVRVLRRGGRVVMIEPLATNPPAWLYRHIGRLFAREATSEETPLRVKDLKVLRKYFRRVQWQGMFLMSVALFGLDRIAGNSNSVVHSLSESAFTYVFPLDSVILKIPGLQRIAWKIGVVAEL
ncbi:MAG: class I SAM-dependent methyltransferase [Candidatus Sulfotelmatobacter sp.]